MTRNRIAAAVLVCAAIALPLFIAFGGVQSFTGHGGALAAGGGCDPFQPNCADQASLAKDEPGDDASQMEDYWSQRVTYPTGNYNPQWLRNAAAEAKKIPVAIPAGHPGSFERVTAAGKREAAQFGNPLAPITSSFIALGPQPLRMTGCSGCYDYTKTEGRVNAIVVDPTTTTNGSIVAYLASVGGGVWKTTNCCTTSTTWSVMTDNNPLISSISIDALAIDPNNHNTIYAGTGDLNFGSFSMGSQGILKSTDGGATWTVLGANVFGPSYSEPSGQFMQYDAVGKVAVDPNNSSNVVAGTKKGLFFSYDGGTDWTGPCAPDSYSTQRQDITGLVLSDMGGGITRILAAVGTRGFASPVQYDLGSNGANGVYSGTMPASGCPSDFASITTNANGFVFGTAVTGMAYTTGANMNATTGNPYVSATSGDQLGRIDIAVAPSNPNVIYAEGQAISPNNDGSSTCGNTNGCGLGTWASTDGGATWSYMAGSQGASLHACASSGAGSSTTAGSGDYPQNWYDQGIAVDPNNPDRIFVDTFDIWMATRTGTTWYDTTCGYNGTSAANHVVHVDQHALAFVNGSSSTLLAGSDGGVFSTLNADQTALNTQRPTWQNMDNGLNTIEFYSGDISGNFATSSSPSAAAGAQDNAPSVASFPGGAIGPVQWQMTTGGDGFSGQIDPIGTGFGLRYYSGNNSGGLSRCVTSATRDCVSSGTGYSSVRGSWTGDTQSFVLPINLFHGGIPGGDDCPAAGTPGGCGHLLAGTTRVWETVSGGNATMNSSSWYVTNSPSTQNMTKQSLGNRSYINQVKYSPKWQSVAAVGTNDANYWIGFNLGTGVAGQANWVNVTGGNSVLPNRPINGVALDPSSPSIPVETGYAAVGGFNANTPTQPGHVFQVQCTNSCANFTWLDKTGDLPDIPVDSIIVNPNYPQQVYAGTDFGLYFTNDINAASPTWYRFENGLPSVMIWDMSVDRGSTTLGVFTRSRGAYAWPLPSAPITQDQTITVGTHAPASAVYGTHFTVSATSDSGLPVTYGSSGGCSNVGADFTMTSGTTACTVTYDQAGNIDYNAAPQKSDTVTAQKADQTITVGTHAPASAVYGTGFTVAATSESGNPVSYGSSGGCSNSGADYTMTSGTTACTVTYDAAGNADYNAASQISETVTAQKANQVIHITKHAPKFAIYGVKFTVAATSGSGDPVTYGSAGACTNLGSVYMITDAGTCTVTYDQAGDSNYLAASQKSDTVTVKKTKLGAYTTQCHGTLYGTGYAVVVPAGKTCGLLPGTHVKQSIIVKSGGTLYMNGVKVGGTISTSGDTTVCGSDIGHDVKAGGGSLTLGGPGCAGNTVKGDAFVTKLFKDVWVWGNTIHGTLNVSHDTGSTTSIDNNHVSDLSVTNSGPPVDVSGNHTVNATCSKNTGQTGSGNTATGKNSCPK